MYSRHKLHTYRFLNLIPTRVLSFPLLFNPSHPSTASCPCVSKPIMCYVASFTAEMIHHYRWIKTACIFVSWSGYRNGTDLCGLRKIRKVKMDNSRCPRRELLNINYRNKVLFGGVVMDTLKDNTAIGAPHPPLLLTFTLNKAIIIEFHLNE